MARSKNIFADRAGLTVSAVIALGAAAAIALAACGCAVSGVINSEEHALNTDLSTQPFGTLADGVYLGEATVTPPSGYVVANSTVSVRVTVENGSVSSIKVDEPEGIYDIAGFSDLEGRVIARGGLDVDCVSGATYSSIAFLKATERAVSK